MKLKEQKVIGLSATPKREDGEDMKVFGSLGQIVYQISLRELIDQGYLCDAEVEWIELPEHESRFYQTYQEIYSDYVVNNFNRNEEIVNVCFGYQDKKILILVNQIEHGEYLLSQLDKLDVIFIHSKAKDKDFNHQIIIATSILDEGIDLPDREIIVLAGAGKSSIKITQRIGRVLRTHPNKKKALIVDFVDDAKYLDKHYKKRKEMYDEYGFKDRKIF